MTNRLSVIAAVTISALAVAGSSAGADKKIKLGFSQIGAESEWRTANTKSVKEAAEAAGIDLKFSDAQQKQENQIKAIRSFIAQKVDVIAFSPVVETGWEPVLREAKAAKIPVILTDRAVNVKDESLWVSFMGSDFVEEGRRAANWLVEKTKDNPGPINIVELGLVYECKIETAESGGRIVKIKMTLTAPGCGMGEVLVQDVRDKLEIIPTVSHAEVQLVFDPPWNQSMMSEAARLQTGMMW